MCYVLCALLSCKKIVYYVYCILLLNLILSLMKLTCPECKNDVSLAAYPDLKQEDIVECGTCGITLMITNMTGEELQAEIADEGK